MPVTMDKVQDEQIYDSHDASDNGQGATIQREMPRKDGVEF